MTVENASQASEKLPFAVVGVVSSAGGLEALGRLLSAVSPSPGVAFVVVPHLDPARSSMMSELLSRHTSLPVVEASDGVVVTRNCVYIIPPNATMRIIAGRLRLTSPDATSGAAGSLDDFLTSLAEDCGNRAIGVVLSGTGNHGTRGLRAVRARGGRTIAQDPSTASFPSMPQGAIDAGVVDVVLAPEEMAAAVVSNVQPRIAGEIFPNESDRVGVAAIIDVVKRKTGKDFGLYRPGMLTRRIERRASLRGTSGVAEYLAFLQEHPEELDELVSDLLISVTRFFRDGDAFAVLEAEVIPAIMSQRSASEGYRVWVPGCASGEEAYSIAMLFLEKLERIEGGGKVQIFATDIDVESLSVARNGIYLEEALADVSPVRRERFFVPDTGRSWKVTKALRDSVVFAPQNVLSDPPFSRLDLISCRNLLIYLEPVAQQRVIAQFAFALKGSGFLFLGPSESLGNQADLFDVVSSPWRIYRRTGQITPGRLSPPASVIASNDQITPGRVGPPAVPTTRAAELTIQMVLAEFSPAAALVDASGLVEYTSGPISRFMALPAGELSHDILAMVLDGLRGATRAALLQAVPGGPAIGPTDAWVKRNDGYYPVRVTVRPVPTHRSPRPLFLVVFEESPASGPIISAPEPLIQHLEQELKSAREDLQATVAANQLAGEDLRAANEEMLSVNEELQSTVEELETSKEELQSLNEELTTTNAQLREKSEALTVTNADITNLLHTIDVAAVFVGPDERIRRFTPAATRLFHLIPTDVGRPLADIAHTMLDSAFHDDVRAAIHGAEVLPDREVAANGDRWFMRRALPYRLADGRTDGVLLTFSDVTILKRAEIALRRNKELQRLAAVLIDSTDAIVLVEPDGRVSAWNHGAEQMYGYSEADAIGKSFDVIVPDSQRSTDLAAIDAVRRGEPMRSWDSRRVAKDGRMLEVSITASQLIVGGGAPAVSLIERDQTERNQMISDIKERSDRWEAILGAAADPIITINEHGQIESVNPATERVFGWSPSELVNQNVSMLMPPEFREHHSEYIATYLRTGIRKVIGIGREVVCLRKDGSTFSADLAVGQVDHGGRFVGIIRDATERKRLEREVLEIAASEQELFGRELHDTVGQELTGLRLMTEGLLEDMRQHGSTDLALAERINEGLRVTLSRVRTLSRGLVAPETDAAGLVPAIEVMAARVREMSGVECTFACPVTVNVPNDYVATHLLRIAQEAVTNSLRHSGAKRISIALVQTGHAIDLRIRDDGRGLPLNGSSSEGGLGIKFMRYRAGLIGAVLYIDTGPNGTQVTCSLPQEPKNVTNSNAKTIGIDASTHR